MSNLPEDQKIDDAPVERDESLGLVPAIVVCFVLAFFLIAVIKLAVL